MAWTVYETEMSVGFNLTRIVTNALLEQVEILTDQPIAGCVTNQRTEFSLTAEYPAT